MSFFRSAESYAALNANRLGNLPKLKLKSKEQIQAMQVPKRVVYIEKLKSELDRLDWDRIFTNITHSEELRRRGSTRRLSKLNQRLVNISTQTKTLQEELVNLGDQ